MLLIIQIKSIVIDLGSCITYDLIDSEGIHHGGSISPGFGMRYKSMNDYSGALPLLDFKELMILLGNSLKKQCIREFIMEF